MCQLDHSQEMTGNRVMAGFIGEVLATHPTRVFTLFVFNRRLESRWNLRISDSKGKCMGNQFQTSCGACWWESSCQQLLGAFQQKKTGISYTHAPCQGNVAEQQLRADWWGWHVVMLCYVWALPWIFHGIVFFFQKSMEISDPSFAVEYGHAYGNYVYI